MDLMKGSEGETVPVNKNKLDDDEDRRKPQYVPKRGTFYKHDDRTAAEDTFKDAADKDGERRKDGQNEKKLWKEHENRWSHDKYNEDEQRPKSEEELIAVYGYDIRKEDAPPRARSGRKYGWGPNKYTRNWEDEDACGKSSAVILRGIGSNRRRSRGGRRGGSFGSNPHYSEKEFPPLGGVSSNKAESSQGSNNSVYASRAAERRQVRGESKSQHRAAFPPLSPLDQTKSDHHRKKNFSNDDRFSGTVTTNAWRKDTNQNRVEIRDDVQKPYRGNWRTTFSSYTSSSGSNTNRNISNRNSVQVDEKRERMGVKSRWKHSSRTSEKRLENEGEEDGARCVNNRPAQGKKSVIPLESQTFTSSGVPRGRGQIRKSTGHQSNISRGRGNGRGATYRSHSETRVSSHDERRGSEGGGFPVHVINRAPDNVTRDMGRVSLHDQQLGKDCPRRPSKTQRRYQNPERRQPVVPPRMQENAANKPKRYSSQRPKSRPETGGPNFV